jgi:hypothetical protein
MAEFKWDTEKLVGTVGKNQKGDEIQIRLTSLKGKSYTMIKIIVLISTRFIKGPMRKRKKSSCLMNRYCVSTVFPLQPT